MQIKVAISIWLNQTHPKWYVAEMVPIEQTKTLLVTQKAVIASEISKLILQLATEVFPHD